MIFFDKTRTIGQDANGKNVVWVSIYVDTAANLPAYNDYQSDGFIMCMASEGRCIDTGDLYRLDSSGVWQISQAGTGTYTKAEIDALLNAKQDVLSFDATPTQNSTNPVTSGGIWTDQQRQEAEIGVVANAGAKNYCPKETETSTGSGFTADVEVNIPAGTYILSFTGTLAYTASFNLYRALPHSGNSLASINLVATTGAQSAEFTITEAAKYIAFYHNGSGNSMTNIMIRPAAITDPTFQPYAKTNRELTVLTDEDRAALVELVDGGAKNHCTLASGSNTPPARWINIPVSDVGAGQWVMSFGTLTSTDTDDTFCQAICINSSSQQVSNWVNFKRESNTNKIFTTTDDVSYVRLYPANSYATSEGDTVTFNNAMMCSKAAWEISQAYQPYRPSWQEMYGMILALQ